MPPFDGLRRAPRRYTEIDDFNSAAPDSERRVKRLLRIVKHFGHVTILPAFAKIGRSVDPSRMSKVKQSAATRRACREH